MPEPYTDARGIAHDASVGWTDDDHAAVGKLHARQRELAEVLAFLVSLNCPGVTKARMTLKHIDDPADVQLHNPGSRSSGSRGRVHTVECGCVSNRCGARSPHEVFD